MQEVVLIFQVMNSIEFLVCRRALPHYKKEVDAFVVGVCPVEVWASLRKRYGRF